MRLDLRTLAALYRTELRMALRDRRTVFFSLVLPLAVMPVMIFSSLWVQQRRSGELAAMTHAYAVCGPQADAARAWIKAAVERPTDAPVSAPLSAAGQAWLARPTHFAERRVSDPAAELERAALSFYVEAAGGQAPPPPTAAAGETVRAREAIRLTVVYRGDRDASLGAAFELRRRLNALRQDLRAQRLEARGFPVTLDAVARVADQDVATPGQVAGLNLGRLLTLFLLMFVFTGGAVVATDTLAGEKERGTLETLLATAAGRAEIIAAKSLLILTAATVITLIQALNFLVYVLLKVVPASGALGGALTPATVGLLFVLYLPVIALVSSALLATSGRARSYKEAHFYFMPLMLLALLPALAPVLPAVRLRSIIVLVPIANLAVAAKEILSGTRDWPFIALAWLATALAAVALARFSARLLRNERLISAADVSREELLGGPQLFPRRVARAFALMWVAGLGVAGYAGDDLRLQLVASIGGVLLGGSLLLARLYRLDAKNAFALRAPRPAVWLGVALAAPGGLLVASGIGRLVGLVLPMPSALTEEYARRLFASDVPAWQMLPLLTLLPGIGEELAFRGLLLYGLRRRFRPAALACVVGAVFGVFHFDLMRLIPTACLGAALAGVTLLSGSIFPAMAWHALNNGLGIAAASAGFPIDDLPPGLYVTGVVLLALAFWIFGRARTPYPDLRGRR